MKPMQLKTLFAALAVAGFASACDRDTVRRDGYVPPEPPAVERSTVAPGTTNPGALSMEQDAYGRDANMADRQANVDHEETVQFQGSELTDAGEEALGDLVSALDKDKPVSVIIAIQEGGSNISGNTEADAARRDMAGTDNAGAIGNGAVFAERVDRLREYLQEQGVDVVQWQFEGMAPQQTLDQQQNMQEENVQQVRIVIAGKRDADGISAL